MKQKKEIYFQANQEDILPLIGLMVDKITQRTANERKRLFEIINSRFADTEQPMTGQTLVNLLSELTQVSAQEAIEFEDILPLISLIASEEEGSSEAQLASNTEVLEDLSDLEEDGLRIDSGSIEPINISSDHSKK